MEPFLCPFPDCDRSHGKGFTRKENLETHKRRRHLGPRSTDNRSQLESPSASPSTSTLSAGLQVDESMVEEGRLWLQAHTQFWYAQLRQRDEYIRELEARLATFAPLHAVRAPPEDPTSGPGPFLPVQCLPSAWECLGVPGTAWECPS
ncbi:uncharacterized protein PV07_08757 [Cladophialophora immunda]|uniref:C2H2-type domain-containing protein n=1 Tax=Cladophialophora immunda TaxID=569365 RepID=A0A0D1ZCX3_9EURO|nr:uncharacterized protein PV07_08757 [Cladophialophora immunda]KIW25591.1 hypothetical protein PV07_08757 [Cladophialophora immunda]